MRAHTFCSFVFFLIINALRIPDVNNRASPSADRPLLLFYVVVLNIVCNIRKKPRSMHFILSDLRRGRVFDRLWSLLP